MLPSYRALPNAPDSATQVLGDLHRLNEVEALADGTIPMHMWLANAAALTSSRMEEEEFRGAISRLDFLSDAGSGQLQARLRGHLVALGGIALTCVAAVFGLERGIAGHISARCGWSGGSRSSAGHDLDLRRSRADSSIGARFDPRRRTRREPGSRWQSECASTFLPTALPLPRDEMNLRPTAAKTARNVT